MGIQQELQSYNRKERDIYQQYHILQQETKEKINLIKNIKYKEKCLTKLSETITSMNESYNNNMCLSVKIKHGKCIKSKQEPNMDEKKIRQQISSLTNHWKERKLICMDFIHLVSDAMERKVSVIMKIMNCESDESVGVIIPKAINKNMTEKSY